MYPPSQVYRLALIGFGNVGQGFATILRDRGPWIEAEHNARFVITAVSDALKGSVADPRGLDPAVLLEAVTSRGRLDSVPALHRGWDALTTIQRAEADVVVELSFTDLQTGEPAATHLRAALNAGRHVVTTNKGPIALHYGELTRLAFAQQRLLGFEGAVMSGTPVLRMGVELLKAARINRVEGILNGTTNFILTEMESGRSYADALAEAQRLGYAEANPAGDVEGHDVAAKVVILGHLLFREALRVAEVDRTGITGLTPADIAAARAAGERWKLVGAVWPEGAHLRAEVKPRRLPGTHPLAGIGGPTNALLFETEMLGTVTVSGPGAGRVATGYAILGDLLALHRKNSGPYAPRHGS